MTFGLQSTLCKADVQEFYDDGRLVEPTASQSATETLPPEVSTSSSLVPDRSQGILPTSFIADDNAQILNWSVSSVIEQTVLAAQRYSLPEKLFIELVRRESAFQVDVVSSAGAVGLAQLMPGTASDLGVDPSNPLENLDGGARYLLAQYNRFGRWDLALAAYNAGPGAVEQYNGIPPYRETQNYVQAILSRAPEFSTNLSRTSEVRDELRPNLLQFDF